MPPPPPPPPPPVAKPVLASTLLSNLLGRHRVRRGYRNGHGAAGKGGWDASATANRVRSGFGELDDYVLMGGMERGAVVGISGDVDGAGGGEGRLISLHVLTTVLLSSPLAKASIIDTTGSFPVSLLARIVRFRLGSQPGQAGRGAGKHNIERELDEGVKELLGRVAISRVFDIEGVWEVLSEISADCQSPLPGQELSNSAEKLTEGPDQILGQINAAAGTARNIAPKLEVEAERENELEIKDSEAEEDDEDIEEVDISHTGNTDLLQDINNAPDSLGTSIPSADPTLRAKPPEGKGQIEIIIIDSMTSPISELFSHRERTSAHTLLSTFSRTFHTLCHTHNILSLLLNTLHTPPPRDPSHHSSSGLSTKPTSIFAATTARPALGRLFSDLCALHLLITQVPKTAKDTSALYASPPSPSAAGTAIAADDDDNDDDERESQKGPPLRDPQPPLQQDATITTNPLTTAAVQYASVIEVLKDTTFDLDAWLPPLSLPPPPPLLPLDSTASLLAADRKRPWQRGRARKRNRAQRWAPFVVSEDGLALQDAFGLEKAGRQVAALGQTHIVKQFPFGRRV